MGPGRWEGRRPRATGSPGTGPQTVTPGSTRCSPPTAAIAYGGGGPSREPGSPRWGEDPLIDGRILNGGDEQHAPGRVFHVDLAAGSLLLMSYETQLHYTHGIPKTNERVGPRISLAFRVKPARDSADQAGVYR